MDGPGAKGPQSGDCVRVAVNIRPLITPELLDGCNDCITVVPGEPQVQIGSHVFTYDHVYGSSSSPLSAIYDESVAPLVDSLFSGYNATVLAYGQTGSGKTYTMGTNYSGDASASGIIPKVMEHIFKKVEATKDNTEFLIRVSFIEIFKEEVFDLLDSSTTCRNEGTASAKSHLPARVPIQIRETTNGGITLAGVNEAEVCSKEEMASFLSRGSLARATACTNMNSQSSRSHAIFTISMEMKKTNSSSESGKTADDEGEDILSAKLHLVDLAGSERAKRTGADGLRLKEGIHINRGLLALGNVISALGDEKKRKEGGHVPYRDSKLTRLLQDSLGGNSKTVMIACVSPADTNAEETLNTLKYANRARNIQNKAVVNRDPVAAQMQKMRSQLEQLQAELLHYQGCGTPIEGLQIMQHKIALLESRNAELCRELNSRQIACESLEKRAVDAQLEKDMLILQLESLQHGKLLDENDTCDKAKESNLLKGYISKIQDLELKLLQSQRLANPQQLTFGDGLDVEDISLNPDADLLSTTGDIVSCSEVDTEDNEKELEYSTLQIKFGEELQELNKQLKLKEEEMKQFSSHDASTLKQHYEKKLCDLEQDKKALQKEIEHLRHLVANISSVSDDGAQKLKQEYLKKLTCLEAQVAELKKKQEANSQILRQKQKSDDAAKRLQEEILRIKTQKVQLQQKIKQESEQFRAWKASREKEVLQLKKEGRRNEYEMHKLAALNQRQKMVLQRKTEEAALATKRLKELLDAKRNPKDSSGNGNMNAAGLQALMQAIEHELEVTVRVHEVRSEYERQCEARAAMANEIARLRDEHALLKQSRLCDSPHAMSPSARNSRIFALENMLKTSSSTLVAMASQLSEAEERERVFSGRGRWNQIRSLPEAKNLLNFLFNLASSSRCQLRDKEAGLRETDSVIRELKQKVFTLSTLVRQLETQNSKLETQIQAQRAPRKSTVFTNTAVDTELGEDMDTSESEPEEDLSDEDWVQSARKWPKKRSRTSIRGSMLPELVRKPQKLNLDILKDSPDGELEKNNTPCCSCTKNSSCKTKKCECRDRGGLCGPFCGCVAAKCSNRVAEPLTVKEEEASGAELAEHEDNEKTVVTLASEGAALLRKALDDKPPEAEHEESARKPLSDIGNTKANGTAAKPGKRKNWRKSVPKFKTVVIPDTPQNANTGSQQVKAKSDAPLPLKLPRAMTASAQNNPPLAEKNTADNKETIHIGRPSKDSEGKENERV